jgi:hypothetical protein
LFQLWNEIRDHIRERLPAIVDFLLFAMVITTTAAVLLGLTWLYVNYGLALFVVAVVLLLLASNFAGRRAPGYFDGGSPLALGGDKPALPPPGQQALPPSGTPQIGRSNQALTKHRPALPKRSPK